MTAHLFQRGQSGNPHGITSEQKKIAMDFRYKCASIAINKLPLIIEIMDNPDTPPNVRLAAWNAIADRGLGKAVQAIQVDNISDTTLPSMMTKEQLDSFVMGDLVATLTSMNKDGKLPEILNKIGYGVNSGTSNKEANPKP